MSPRPILPISLYLEGRAVLLVGSGALAVERRVRLDAAGAAVRQVAPAEYRPDMCAAVFLVIASSDDAELDRRIVADARPHGGLVYAHDQPAISDLAMPAVIRRGPLSIAIATDGQAPVLARRLREELERLLDAAAPWLDPLIARLVAARGTLAPGGRAERLYDMVRGLRFGGPLQIEEGSQR